MPNVAGGLTHEEFQGQVVEAARLMKWKHLHVRRTIGRGKKWVTSTNRIGWPDLFLWHPEHGFLAIELKVGKDAPSHEQTEVLSELAAAGAATMVAYPTDWDAVVAALRGEPAASTSRQ